MDCDKIIIPDEFKDICPFCDSEFQKEMSLLVKEPGFEHAVKYVMPDVNFPEFAENLCSIKNQEEFQLVVMKPFLELLERKTSDGISSGGLELMGEGVPYTFITNHRDIVLDASFLNLVLLRNSIQSTEVAIGNNLLIYDWIDVLVRLNKSFIVKRDVGMRKALDAAKNLSKYIHFTITEKKQSVWIAQREGRAKDSNDVTQESLIKMLGLGGGKDFIDNIKELNLMPVSISYEYDPNDYLKAKEFLMKRNDPEFKKSQRDDLFSMETGILQYKGRINFEFSPCINDLLSEINPGDDKAEVVKRICNIIDDAIHLHYKIYPCNYIAYDELNGTTAFAVNYNSEDVSHFNKYIDSQLAKIDIEVNEDERKFLYKMMLKMYANPLTNKLKVADRV